MMVAYRDTSWERGKAMPDLKIDKQSPHFTMVTKCGCKNAIPILAWASRAQYLKHEA